MSENTIIIVAEKPSVIRAIAPSSISHWSCKNIVFVSAIPYSNFQFKYPRGLAARDYPYLQEPVMQLSVWDKWHPKTLSKDGQFVDFNMTDEIFKSAKEIVCACDMDATGMLAFDTLVKAKFGNDHNRSFQALTLNSLAKADIDKAMSSIVDFQTEFTELVNAGRVKRYVDFNWNLNALVILGSVARAAGQKEGTPPISKYSLQIMYFLEHQAGHMKDAQLVFHLNNWVGSGKHKNPISMGSAASYAQMIENLETSGFITTQPVCDLTELGRRVLSKLHKDCRDQDLPYRITEWCSKDYSLVKPQIDRYINTFFGKQQRFTAKK